MNLLYELLGRKMVPDMNGGINIHWFCYRNHRLILKGGKIWRDKCLQRLYEIANRR